MGREGEVENAAGGTGLVVVLDEIDALRAAVGRAVYPVADDIAQLVMTRPAL
jgi:hypothetical protein